jgi:hypothetical protein
MRRCQANYRGCSGRYANSQRKPSLNIFLINERLRTFREDSQILHIGDSTAQTY